MSGGRYALLRQQRIKQEQACAGDDGAIGYVEVGPGIAEDVDFDEVDDGAVEDAVVDVAQRSSQNQREGDGGEREPVAQADEGNENGAQECDREADQDPADEMR